MHKMLSVHSTTVTTKPAEQYSNTGLKHTNSTPLRNLLSFHARYAIHYPSVGSSVVLMFSPCVIRVT